MLEDAVDACDVLIALIGRDWLTLTDASGIRRLDNPEEFVRVEITSALEFTNIYLFGGFFRTCC